MFFFLTVVCFFDTGLCLFRYSASTRLHVHQPRIQKKDDTQTTSVSQQVHHQPHCRRRVSFCSSATLSEEDLDQDSTLNDTCLRRRVTFLSSLTSLSEDLDEDSSLFCVSSAPLSEDLDQDSTVNEACFRRRVSLLN